MTVQGSLRSDESDGVQRRIFELAPTRLPNSIEPSARKSHVPSADHSDDTVEAASPAEFLICLRSLPAIDPIFLSITNMNTAESGDTGWNSHWTDEIAVPAQGKTITRPDRTGCSTSSWARAIS
jgi:hypothetical protein